MFHLRNVAFLTTLPFIAITCAAPSHAPDPASHAATIAQVLDDFHEAAARADEDRYFSHFAPEGVFLGTDGSELGDVAEFRAYAHPHFAKGTGWTYRATTRHIQLSPDGTVAWFDEVLANESYGPCRGTGVLRRINGNWKIAQYNLTIPIPNDLAQTVVGLIRKPRA